MAEQNVINVPFGMADITVEGESIGLQADAATFTAEPKYVDIETYELGLYDKYLEGWDVKVKVVFQEESYEKLKIALPVLEEVTTGSEKIGLKDGRLHQRVRDKGKEIKIHPRDAGLSKEFDVTIFKAYPVGVFERKYGKETSKFEVEFVGLPMTGDSTKGGNFFLIGEDSVV
ncbi:hypothetical protein [Neobacillus mesonae]|uniref:hypothetical protein n=1 Tax=Neobacillus mesonae TaxID=1193713 RepID=UPI00257253B0|nr:hypothetical protein [Neobacillus mesonae]